MVETIQDIYLLLSMPYALLMLAFILDLCIGDPGWLPHPVRVMGRAITGIENFLRNRLKGRGQRVEKRWGIETRERWAGILLVVIMTGSTFTLFYIITAVFRTSHFQLLTSCLSLLVIVYLISTTLAAKELIGSARCVIEAFKNKNIEGARKNLHHIVGRDTDSLDEKGILKATIESLAENASDGIIAPLLYFAIGGLPLVMTYKVINTLDSMIGYKNKKYRHFGWAAARLDDIANYIPARITGLLIVASTFILTLFKNTRYFHDKSRQALLVTRYSLNIMLRDGRRHSSPNSGVPEAAMAGALGVQLGGPSAYRGIVVEKPFIGENLVSAQKNSQGISPRMSNRMPDLSFEEYIPLLHASERAISIVKVTSLLGLGFSLVFQYLRIMIL